MPMIPNRRGELPRWVSKLCGRKRTEKDYLNVDVKLSLHIGLLSSCANYVDATFFQILKKIEMFHEVKKSVGSTVRNDLGSVI